MRNAAGCISQIRSRPTFFVVTNPQSSSTRMCLSKVGKAIGIGVNRSPTAEGLALRRITIARRV